MNLAFAKGTAHFWKNHAKALEAKLNQRLVTTTLSEIEFNWCYEVGQVFQDLPEGPEMVVLPSGSYLMGSDKLDPYGNKDEFPQHRVSIDYQIAVSRNLITFAQWDAFAAAGGKDSFKPEDQRWGRGQRPVIDVNRQDAMAYAKWANKRLGISQDDIHQYRLPSESEWEYACRAGTTTDYNTPSGLLKPDDATYDASEKWVFELAKIVGHRHDQTSQVGVHEPNAWGLFDMHGNVSEWVQDDYEHDYRDAPTNGNARAREASESTGIWRGTGKDTGVIRGGGWDSKPRDLRSASRLWSNPVFRSFNVGFRLVRTLP